MVGLSLPYSPPAKWWAAWLASRLQGAPMDQACEEACRKAGIMGKDYARCLIRGNMEAPVMLSVAVEGGASRLKHRPIPSDIGISSHGNWPHVHLGALEAAYGRAPFYQHFIPSLREAILTPATSLKELNRDVFLAMLPMAGLDGEINTVRISGAALRRGEEIASLMRPDLSLIDPLMRLGTETLLGLLHLARNA